MSKDAEKRTVFLLWKEFNFKKDNFLIHTEQKVVFFYSPLTIFSFKNVIIRFKFTVKMAVAP